MEYNEKVKAFDKISKVIDFIIEEILPFANKFSTTIIKVQLWDNEESLEKIHNKLKELYKE